MSQPRKRKVDDSPSTPKTPPPHDAAKEPRFSREEGERLYSKIIGQPAPVPADVRVKVERILARLITVLSAKSPYDFTRFDDSRPAFDELVPYVDVIEQCFTVDSAAAVSSAAPHVVGTAFANQPHATPADLAIQRMRDAAYGFLHRRLEPDVFCSISNAYGIPAEAPPFSQTEESGSNDFKAESESAATLPPLPALDLGPTVESTQAAEPESAPPAAPTTSAAAAAVATPSPPSQITPLPSHLLSSLTPSPSSSSSSAVSTPVVSAIVTEAEAAAPVRTVPVVLRTRRITDQLTPSQTEQVRRAAINPTRLYGVNIISTAVVTGAELTSDIKFSSSLSIVPMPVASDPLDPSQFWSIARLRLAVARDRMTSEYDRKLTDEIIRRMSQISDRL